MSEATYYLEVRCEVAQVSPPLDRIAEFRDFEGRLHQINVPRNMIVHRGNVPRNMIVHRGDKSFLPIGIVEIDRRGRKVLIEFPVESGQGTNRAWMDSDDLRIETRAVAV